MYDIKFKIGQKVYPINHSSRLKGSTCPICEGEKHITIRNHMFPCPNCHGRGNINKQILDWNPVQPKTIQAIHVRKDKNSYKITYDFVESNYYGCSTYFVSQENLFASKQEAEEECKRRNECE